MNQQAPAQAQFEIDGTLPDLNDYVKACNGHWAKGNALKAEAEKHIGWCIRDAMLPYIGGKVDVHFHWIEPDRRRDKDNVCFAKKFILDALTDNHVIGDDGWKYINDLSDSWSVDKDEPRIVVTITRAQA